MRVMVFAAFLLFGNLLLDSNAQLIPGTQGTISGYDVENGKDAVCWTTRSSFTENNGVAFPNPLVESFRVPNNEQVLLSPECIDMYLQVEPPSSVKDDSVLLRTRLWYDYSVEAQIRLEGDEEIFSDEGIPQVALQIIVCLLSATGFCSPFVHEQANARLEALNQTVDVPRGALHGDTHVHSPYWLVNFTSSTDAYEINVQVPMLVNEPGDYFAIGALQWYTRDSVGTIRRYDMANAIPNRILAYQDPPELNQVTASVLITSHVAIGLVALVLLGLTMETIRLRDSQVLRLTQWGFLACMNAASLTATTFSFMMEPKNDLYCQLAYPILFISLQIIFAIMLGRLWRINALVSPLLRLRLGSLQQQESKRPLCTKFSCANGGLRREVSPKTLVLLVTALVLPQVILQILSVILQPRTMTFEMNADLSQGKAVCQTEGLNFTHTIAFYGGLVFLVLVIGLLYLAHSTRKLPSLLNESRLIFESTMSTVVLIAIGGIMIVVTNDPETTPDVPYIVGVATVICLTLNVSIRTTWPKLKMVWRGETIVVSKLIDRGNKGTGISGMSGEAGQATQRDSTGVSSVDESAVFHQEVEERPPTPCRLNSHRSPPRELVLQMVDCQQQLYILNGNIMSGMPVAPDAWEETKRLTSRLHETLALAIYVDDGTKSEEALVNNGEVTQDTNMRLEC